MDKLTIKHFKHVEKHVYINSTFRLKKSTVEHLRQIAKTNDTSMNKVVDYLISSVGSKEGDDS